mgnify:CR=1 FL=1
MVEKLCRSGKEFVTSAISVNTIKGEIKMSRIGKLPIEIPQGVDVKVEEHQITVTGPNGTEVVPVRPEITIKLEDGHIVVTRVDDSRMARSLHGLSRTLINNMVIGVTEGYAKKLEVNGVGYRAQKSGKTLNLSLGYSHPVDMVDPEGIEVEVPDQATIIVKGIDKEKVGQYAAEIRSKREPEPYKGKGIKYADEVIRRKVGKTGKK